jgi:hypothetical protein
MLRNSVKSLGGELKLLVTFPEGKSATIKEWGT